MSELNTLSAGPAIRVRGARTHNLQNLSVDLPRDRLVVFTGVSGSGKSSLAFDTLYAEGQRRYLESLSAQSRQWLDQLSRPDVDEIEGLPPAIAVEQRRGFVSPRSTLATLTEIHDFLRVLYARAGTPYCPQCGSEISSQPVEAILNSVLSLETGAKVMLLAPLIRGRKGTHREVFEKIVRDGMVRARVDGEIVDAATPPDLKKTQSHTIEAVVDRLVVKDSLRPRLVESVELALRVGSGCCIVVRQNSSNEWVDELFSTRFACARCELSFPDLEPRSFSFNSPHGACPECQGLGTVTGPAAPAPRKKVAKKAKAKTPPADNPDKAAPLEHPCPACSGTRLAALPRHVKLMGVTLPEWTATAVTDAHAVALRLAVEVEQKFKPDAPPRLVAQKLLPEITRRLEFLQRVGLHYLALDRAVITLSGGELQRARLARGLGAGLLGVMYVLDEPTTGLHPRDTAQLLDALRHLRDAGNSVMVVEHDPAVMAAADDLLDLGPGAGREGGQLVAHGTPAEVARHPTSLTGRYLPGAAHPARKRLTPVRSPDPARVLTLRNTSRHNLRELTVEIPLGRFVCVTGVSGSGKSSLIMETLVPLLRQQLPTEAWGGKPVIPAPLVDIGGATLEGAQSLARLVQVDQSPLGRSGRSNPATVSGVWDLIRKLFARTKEAKLRGFGASRFSFNAAGGRCETCRGSGTRRLAMHYLPDLEVVCSACQGRRFNRQTLRVAFRGLSVADLLDLRIDAAAEFFASFAEIHRRLQGLVDVGLGYLQLGQSALTLSGGESQRIKLAVELNRARTAGDLFAPTAGPLSTIYVLDEPTTGLHPADVDRLLAILQRLVDEGHSVIVIEHDLQTIAQADWILDLGPEGGRGGGSLVAAGPPAEIARCQNSFTGAALRLL